MPLPDRYSYSLLSDTVYLRDKEHGSQTGFDVNQLRSPGDLPPSDTTPDRKPSHHSPVIGQRIVDPHIRPGPLGVTEGFPSRTTDL